MKKTLLFTLLLAAVLGVSGASRAQGYEERRGRGPVIELFSEPGFRGDRRVLYATEADLTTLGFNDVARSARLRGSWQVCEHTGFGGGCRTISSDDPDFERSGIRNVSSVQLIDAGWGGGASDWKGGGDRGALILFSQEGFGGRSLRVEGVEDDLTRRGFNDLARSLQVRGTWIVCVDSYFNGACRTLSNDIYDLRQIGLLGVISSARPAGEGWTGGAGGGGWDRASAGGTGRTAAFFPRPTRFGGPISTQCGAGRASGDCGQQAADDFCRAQGYRSNRYFSIGFGGRGPSLEDVLCVR